MCDAVLNVFKRSLERIAYRKMESERFFERLHIIVTTFARIIGSMDAYAEVAADNEHRDVEAEAHARTESEILEEGVCL